jgi:hypothetical protein
MTCDNKREAHNPLVIYDNNDAMVAVCTLCKASQVFRKDASGRMDNRAYTQFFRRDVLQANTNLYYKYHPDKMSVA